MKSRMQRSIHIKKKNNKKNCETIEKQRMSGNWTETALLALHVALEKNVNHRTI